MSYQDPNFTIITSGGCNSFCSFCTDPYKRKASPDYLKNVEDVLFNRLPKHFDQISISGGEPTLSPHLTQILGLIKLTNRFRKVVLTTNGAKLKQKIEVIAQGIDHLNVSRHAIGYSANTRVFGTTDIVTDSDLKACALYLNQHGIDVNLNHVYADKDKLDMDYVLQYIEYAKSVGATSVSFRYDQNENSLKQTYLEALFEDWVRVNEGSCPVCRNHTVLVSGMPVVFKAAYAEPSKAIDDVYELIYGIDGKLTTDWDGKTEFTEARRVAYEAEFAKNPNKEHTPAEMGKTIPKIKPRSTPFKGSLADVAEVKNTLPEPYGIHATRPAKPAPVVPVADVGGGCGYKAPVPRPAKTKSIADTGGGCGGGMYGGGCGR
jgi:organic radical activating enzyme